jgi:hypothetical protein
MTTRVTSRMAQIWKSQGSRAHAAQPSPWQPPSDEWDAPVFWILTAILAGAAGLFLVLYFFLLQPTIHPNPGLAAFTPPPGTRLVPLPRKSTAPELADIPGDPPSPLTALAKAQTDDQPVKHETRPPAHRHPRADPSDSGQRSYGFAQPWSYGSHVPSSNNAPSSNNRAWSGGPKSWF